MKYANKALYYGLGFTLAEVLITLAIIGIIAALTIPTLMYNAQKQEYVSGLKKSYSQINQALLQIASDNGCVNDIQCTGLFQTDVTQFGDEFVKYFKIAQNCGVQSGCFVKNVRGDYDGGGYNWNVDSDGPLYYKFSTLDGVSIWVFRYSDCTSDFSTNATGDLKKACAIVSIDVNGNNKSPNWNGRDIFDFYITQGNGLKLYPAGGADADSTPYSSSGKYWNGTSKSCYSGNHLGEACAGRVMDENWQMNY